MLFKHSFDPHQKGVNVQKLENRSSYFNFVESHLPLEIFLKISVHYIFLYTWMTLIAHLLSL